MIQPADFHERCRKWRLLLELHACQARGLGKICGQRTTGTKVLEKVQNFEKVEDFEENTRNSYSNQCFRGLGVLYEYILHGL